MWCEVQKNGTVKYCERYTDPLTEKVKKVTVTMPKASPQNRNKAARILQGKIDKLLTASPVRSNTTLKELADAYIVSLRQRKRKESTIRNEENTINCCIKIIGCDAIVDNLSPRYVNDQLLSSGKNISTVNRYIKYIKFALKWGMKNDYHSNHSLLLKLDSINEESSAEIPDVVYDISDEYLEPEEIQKLLSYFTKNNWQDYYISYFLILTGMRIGEFVALEDSDVDIKSKTIHITKTYYPSTKHATSAKTKDSIRDIHIQPELLTLIKKLRLWRKEAMFENGIKSTLFMPHLKTGGYLSYGTYNLHLTTAASEVLGREITPHKLRHTHASILAETMSAEQISRRLGHHDDKITKAIYIHITQKMIQKDNAAVDSISIIN
mgnify:FL=1